MSTTEDLALVDRAMAGEERAFTALYIRYAPRIHAVVARQTQSWDDAEDVVQETFIRAFGAIDGFRGEAAFSTWLTRIALNLCHSHRRRLQAQQARMATAGTVDDPGTALHPDWGQLSQESPEEILHRKEVQTLIRQGIRALPEVYRKPVELRYLQAYSYDEVAAALRVPLGTVKIWLFRGRRRLKSELDRQLIASFYPRESLS